MPALLNLLSLLFPLCSQCAGSTSDCSPLLHGTVSLGINFPRSLSWPCLFSWLRSLSWLLQGRALYSLMLLKSLGWCPVHTGCSINTLKERLQHCYYFPRYFEFCSTPLGFIVWNFRSLWLESSTRVVGTLKFCYVTLCSIIFSAVQRSIGFCCLWDRYQLQNIFITLQGSLTVLSSRSPLPSSSTSQQPLVSTSVDLPALSISHKWNYARQRDASQYIFKSHISKPCLECLTNSFFFMTGLKHIIRLSHSLDIYSLMCRHSVCCVPFCLLLRINHSVMLLRAVVLWKISPVLLSIYLGMHLFSHKVILVTLVSLMRFLRSSHGWFPNYDF